MILGSVAEGAGMGTRWRRIAVVAVIVVAVTSGWVYPYLRPEQAEVAPPQLPTATPAAPAYQQFWHGRVTRVRGGPAAADQQWLVEYPRTNVFSKQSWIDGMWFWVRAGSVIDRRTGGTGELAVGQRVSVWYSGVVLATDPGQCQADRVVIEPEDALPVRP